jgi:hypothetical protein
VTVAGHSDIEVTVIAEQRMYLFHFLSIVLAPEKNYMKAVGLALGIQTERVVNAGRHAKDEDHELVGDPFCIYTG